MELTEGPRRKVREDTGSLEALRAQLSQQVHETTKAKGEVAALTACMTDHMAPMMDKMAKQAKHITHQLQLKDDTIKQLTLQCQQKEAALQSSVEVSKSVKLVDLAAIVTALKCNAAYRSADKYAASGSIPRTSVLSQAGAQKDATIASQHSKIEHWRSVATKQEQACKEAQGVCSEKDAIIDTLRKVRSLSLANCSCCHPGPAAAEKCISYGFCLPLLARNAGAVVATVHASVCTTSGHHMLSCSHRAPVVSLAPILDLAYRD